MLNLTITRDGFMWALSIACQIRKVPLAATAVMQKHQPPYTLASFRAAAEENGIRLRQKAVPASQLDKVSLPCLAAMMPDSRASGDRLADAGAASSAREYQMALVLRIDERGVEAAEACSRSHVLLTRKEFERRFAGEVLLLANPPESAPVEGQHAKWPMRGEGAPARSGLGWFLPEFAWLKGLRRGAR